MLENLNPDWFLVGLTAVYVVATIAICWANWASASVARKQTNELIRQYNDSVRARIAIRFDRKTPTDRQIVIRNVGKQDAEKVKVSIDPKFIDGLEALFPLSPLKTATNSMIHIAAQQEFWLFVGFASLIDRLPVKVATVSVEYLAGGERFVETTNIDFSQYGFLSEIESSRTVGTNGRHLTF